MAGFIYLGPGVEDSHFELLSLYEDLTILGYYALLFLAIGWQPGLFTTAYLYAADIELERTGASTAGRTLNRLSGWADLPVEELESFLSTHGQFWVLHSERARFGWLVEELDERGYDAMAPAASEGRFRLIRYSAPVRKTP